MLFVPFVAKKIFGNKRRRSATSIFGYANTLLSKHRTEGAGIFSKVTYIQRVNTVGGLAPVEPGLMDGETKEIPYTAEYYFYKAENPSSN